MLTGGRFHEEKPNTSSLHEDTKKRSAIFLKFFSTWFSMNFITLFQRLCVTKFRPKTNYWTSTRLEQYIFLQTKKPKTNLFIPPPLTQRRTSRMFICRALQRSRAKTDKLTTLRAERTKVKTGRGKKKENRTKVSAPDEARTRSFLWRLDREPDLTDLTPMADLSISYILRHVV